MGDGRASMTYRLMALAIQTEAPSGTVSPFRNEARAVRIELATSAINSGGRKRGLFFISLLSHEIPWCQRGCRVQILIVRNGAYRFAHP